MTTGSIVQIRAHNRTLNLIVTRTLILYKRHAVVNIQLNTLIVTCPKYPEKLMRETMLLLCFRCHCTPSAHNVLKERFIVDTSSW